MFNNGRLENVYPNKKPDDENWDNKVIGALCGFAFGNINIESLDFLGCYFIDENDRYRPGQIGSFFKCKSITGINK
jgi:hypothetical protein